MYLLIPVFDMGKKRKAVLVRRIYTHSISSFLVQNGFSTQTAILPGLKVNVIILIVLELIPSGVGDWNDVRPVQ